jgi:hypothetical protein
MGRHRSQVVGTHRTTLRQRMHGASGAVPNPDCSCGVSIRWVPARDEGGDGESSITRLEVEKARELGLEVIPFIAEEDAVWKVTEIEGARDPKAQERIVRFKSELKKSLAGFFETPSSIEASVVLALSNAAERMERSSRSPSVQVIQDEGVDDSDLIVPHYYDLNRAATLEERLVASLPKRVLSLGSGGIRTGTTLGYLSKLEQLLRIRYGEENFRLCDYFDLIGASGMAAIVAASLASGASVAEARSIFVQCANSLFLGGSTGISGKILPGIFSSKFRPQPLQETLEAAFGDIKLSSVRFTTGLCLILSRIDKSNICTVTNHPAIATNDLDNIAVTEFLLACCSTPTYLPPVEIKIGEDKGVYFSGSLAVGSDPALHLLMVATGASFPFHWRTGRRRIFLLSLGSGKRAYYSSKDILKSLPAMQGLEALQASLDQREEQDEMILASLADDPAVKISQSGNQPGSARLSPSILDYRRFEILFSEVSLNGLGLSGISSKLESIAAMDRCDNLEVLLDIGVRAAERDLDSNLFSPSFDVRPPSTQTR